MDDWKTTRAFVHLRKVNAVSSARVSAAPRVPSPARESDDRRLPGAKDTRSTGPCVLQTALIQQYAEYLSSRGQRSDASSKQDTTNEWFLGRVWGSFSYTVYL